MDWWLEWGTLLGCVRHRSTIPWDYDLDLGPSAASLQRLREIMETATLPEGFEYCWYESEGYARFFLHGRWVDLVPYAHDVERGVWVPQLSAEYTRGDGTGDYYPAHSHSVLFPLGLGSIDGVLHAVPNDPDAMLRAWYGDYRRLDGIPLFVSLLHHPIETARFALGYWCRQEKITS